MNLDRDLSKHHELIGTMFPKLSAKEIWEKYKLTDKQVAFFNEYGYLSNIKTLDDIKYKINGYPTL